jgi:RHS repeat-associated protein
LVQELSYDAWSRLRNPETLVAYTPGNEPALLLGRGYTGHEHLAMFGLINMNARLYDPALGRFLSPDPYVQAPGFSQNFNRYSYGLNNPLMYNDETGEFWNLIIGGVIGGVVNWATHGSDFSWKGLGYFGVGALAGALGAVEVELVPQWLEEAHFGQVSWEPQRQRLQQAVLFQEQQ